MPECRAFGARLRGILKTGATQNPSAPLSKTARDRPSPPEATSQRSRASTWPCARLGDGLAPRNPRAGAWLGATYDQVGTVTVGLIGPSGCVSTWLVVAIVLGCIIDSISNMRMLLPIAMLGAQVAGFDMIGFGVKTLVAIEIGGQTPPLSLTCLAFKSEINVAYLRVGYSRRGAFPFVLRKTRRRVILATFRGIATRLAQPQGALP